MSRKFGSLTIQHFKQEQEALREAQIAMRERCVAYALACEEAMKLTGSTRTFAPLFAKMAEELSKIEPREI